MKKKETENTDIKEGNIEIRKISFLPQDQDYLIKLIGAQSYNQLLDACGRWDVFVTQNRNNIKSLKNRPEVISNMLKNESFQTIVETHNKVNSLQENDGKGLILFLIDLIQHQHYDFLIPYMFLTGQVLEGYQNVSFSFLGFPADIIKAAGFVAHELDSQETTIMGGSDE